MVWFLVAQIFSTLISLFQIGRMAESEKDLEIMNIISSRPSGSGLIQTRNPSRYWTDIKRRVQRQADRLGREELYDFVVKFPFKYTSNNRTYQFDCANQTRLHVEMNV